MTRDLLRYETRKVLDKLISLGYNEFTKSEEWFLAHRRFTMKLVNVNNNSEQDYRQFLKDLEHNIFNEYPIIGLANAKLIVTKADFEKHSYSEYEVEMYAYDLAGFVADCIKNTRLS